MMQENQPNIANGKLKTEEQPAEQAPLIASPPLTPAATPPMPLRELRHNPEAIRHAFETGEYPYKTKLNEAQYLKTMGQLQVELLKAQSWIKETNQKIVVLFEGRDGAGKGGTIKRFMEHLNPRGARVIALEKFSALYRAFAVRRRNGVF
jgi:polyphosphate kinase